MGRKKNGFKAILKNAERAAIYITGDIVDDAYGEMVTKIWGIEAGFTYPAAVRKALAESEGPIDIHIASGGGSVDAGLQIANMISYAKAHGRDVVGYVDSWAASAASLIALSCDNLKMPKNTYLMIHNPAATISGTLPELETAMEALRKMAGNITDFYADHMREDTDIEAIEQVKEWMDAETWFTAQEAADAFLGIEVINPATYGAVASIHDAARAPAEVLDALKAADSVEDKKAAEMDYYLALS